MMTGQQGIPSPRTLDAAADLAGRLRLVLTEEDAAAAAEIIVAAGWRPAPPDGPIAELVTDADCRLSEDAWRRATVTRSIGDHTRMRAALEAYSPRLLARHGRGGEG
jgi:hypothetical protein